MTFDLASALGNSNHGTLTAVPVSSLAAVEDERAEAAAEATALSDQLELTWASHESYKRAYEDVRRKLDAQNETIREYIIETLYDKNKINKEEAQDILDALGLKGITRTFEVEVKVEQTVMVEVEAGSEEDAVDKVLDMEDSDILDQCDSRSWQWGNTGYVTERD
jgi:hypothetical protein